jgi:hypothetical protein
MNFELLELKRRKTYQNGGANFSTKIIVGTVARSVNFFLQSKSGNICRYISYRLKLGTHAAIYVGSVSATAHVRVTDSRGSLRDWLKRVIGSYVRVTERSAWVLNGGRLRTEHRASYGAYIALDASESAA